MSFPLTEDELAGRLNDFKGWEYKDSAIYKDFSFINFRQALLFVLNVGFIAENMNHHPELWNSYNKVKITLCTHEAGGQVTDRDLSMAKEIDKIEF